MKQAGLEVAVIGGGIGGLAAALGLARAGARVRLFEQAPAFEEVGAGLQISPNGLRVIEALGLGPALLRGSVRGRAVSLRNERSDEVVRLDLTRLPEGQEYLFVHRADLVSLLAGAVAAAGVEIATGRRVASVVPGQPARVAFSDGTAIDADVVVAADGLHSVARPVLNGQAKAAFTGQVAWRALVPNDMAHPPEARVHMGAGRHIVSYPLRDGTLVNLVAVEERTEWAEEGWNHPDDPANLHAAFAGFGAKVQAMLARVERPLLWGLFRHPVAGNWHGEGLALLGDAAHPTLPFLAQGANMALEDAWGLIRMVGASDSLGAALSGYQALRRARVERVIAAANGNAWKYHLRPGPLRAAAHLGLRVAGTIAPGRMLGQFDWLYGYDITRADLPDASL